MTSRLEESMVESPYIHSDKDQAPHCQSFAATSAGTSPLSPPPSLHHPPPPRRQQLQDEEEEMSFSAIPKPKRVPGDRTVSRETGNEPHLKKQESETNDTDEGTSKPEELPKPHHSRKISWGGTTIEIPNAYEDHFLTLDNDGSGGILHPFMDGRTSASPPPPLEPATLFHGTDYSRLHLEEDERARAAAKAVLATEAALHTTGPSMVDPINLVRADDLAKMHPFDSKAENHVLKGIEKEDRTQVSRRNQANATDAEGPEIEAVASLFTPVHDGTLLGHVPEGAEGIFQHRRDLITERRDSVTESVQSGTGSGRSTSTMDQAGNNLSPSITGSKGTKSDATEVSPNQRRHRRAASHATVGSLESKIISSLNGNIAERQKPPKSQREMNSTNNDQMHHRRQMTVEETLFSLNQALDTVENFTQEVMDVPNSATMTSDANNDEARRLRTTSLDLFNDNMARLFQDGSVNDSRVNPIFGEETVPLTCVIRPSDDINPSDALTVDKNPSLRDESDLESIAYSASTIDEENPPKMSSNRVEFSVRQEQRDAALGGPLPAALDNSAIPVRPNANASGVSRSSGRKRRRSFFLRFFQKIGLLQDVDDFLKPRRPSIWKYLKGFFWLLVVSIAVAAALFYGFGNPPTGIIDLKESAALSTAFNGTRYVTTEGKVVDPTLEASYSWWILFAATRLPVTFSLAKIVETVFIDYMILERRWVVSFVGPAMTLLIVQSKGWPAILFFWSVFNLGLLYGDSLFVAHWLYWQNSIAVFNESNPSGTVTSSAMNLKVQLIAMGLSLVVAIKRLLIGYQQGRKIFLYYAEDLTNIMTNVLLISEVANLAIRLERELQDRTGADADGEGDGPSSFAKRTSNAMIDDATKQLNHDLEEEENKQYRGDDGESVSNNSGKTFRSNPAGANGSKKLLIAQQEKEYVTGRLSASQNRRIERLLGNWEEPEKETVSRGDVSIGAILQFRTSLSKLDSPFPFSFAFGRADSRDHCIESSQDLYLRLLDHSLDPTLHLNILGLIALQRDGSLNQEKLKSLMKLFRPGRDGRLNLVDFVKSVDVVYKEMKLLRASVRSSQKIDQAFERIFNVVFYAIVVCILLAVLGLDPLAIFVSLSTIVLAFSFMISRASSNYFEGLLFILCRRPYDIGDRIVVQPVDTPTSWDGDTTWIVRDIDLFTTTVVYAYTNEVATLNNGSISNSRILNGARSLPALVYITLQIGIDVSYEQIEIFREALAQYVEARPREWSKLWAVRATRVQADQGFIEYLVILEHVDTWQNLDGILFSRGQARGFCHELAKQLQMRYISPPLPVALTLRSAGVGDASGESLERGIAALAAATSSDHHHGPESVATLSAESEHIRSIIQDRRR